MKKLLTLICLLSASTLASAETTLPGDAAHGKTAHDTSCKGCHDNMTDGKGDTLYTREDHRVTSIERLAGQVKRCNAGQKLNLSDNDLDGITKYLNEQFYKF